MRSGSLGSHGRSDHGDKMQYLAELKARLDDAIGERPLAPGEFAPIAYEALASFSPSEFPDPIELLRHAARDRDRGKLPRAHPAATMVTFFRSPVMDIHLSTWVDAFVTPHHHDWEGAFQVIRGEAIQAHYAFEEAEVLDEHFAVGSLTTKRVHRISTGDVTLVQPDARTIHSVQHFPRGSYSIAVRHLHPGTPFPAYWRPGIRVELAYPDEIDKRRAKVLDLLHATNRKEYLAAQEDMVRTGDLREAWYALQHASNMGDGQATARVRKAARSRHGQAAEPIIEGIADKRRSQLHKQFRATLRSPLDRKVLGALYYGNTREEVATILADLVPDAAPLDTLKGWFRSLGERSDTLGDAPVGLTVDETNATLFDHLVEGDDLDGILSAFAEEYGAEQVETHRGALSRNCEVLRSHAAFSGLFSA